MKRSAFLAALGSASAAAVLAGCGSNETDSPGKGSTASGWVLPSEDPTASLNLLGVNPPDSFTPVVTESEKQHPDIKITYSQVPYQQITDVLNSKITTKTGNPDVFWQKLAAVPGFVIRGQLEDLTGPFSDLLSDVVPVTLTSCRYDDKLWALPIDNSSQALYYNAELLDKAGVEPPSTDPDKRITWQQLKADAARVQEKTGVKNGMLFGQPDRYYQLEPLPVSAGGGPGASGPHTLTPEVNNDQWVSTMKYYGSLFADGIHQRGLKPAETGPTFIAGNVGYLIHTQVWAEKIAEQAKFTWDAGLAPMWDGGKPATATGGWNAAMNPFSKNKEAAAVLLKFLALDGIGMEQYRPDPSLPCTKKGVDWYFQLPHFTKSPGGKNAAACLKYEIENTAVPRIISVGYAEFEEFIQAAFADIANGSDAKKSLDGAQDKITQAWEKYDQYK